MSAKFGTILDDLKSSFGQARHHILSYLLANLGMAITLAILLVFVLIPVAIVFMAVYGVLGPGFGPLMVTWAVQNPLLVSGAALLFVIPIISVFLVVVGSIFGMSNDLVTTGETKAESAFHYLRVKFVSFVSAGAMLTIMIIVPQLVVWGLASNMFQYTITGLPMYALSAFSFAWTFVTVGLTSMVLPAIVSGKGVQDAFHESFKLATQRFERVFGLLSAIVLLAAATLAPIIIWGYAAGWTMNPLDIVQVSAVAIVGIWSLFAFLLWALVLYPMMIIGFVRVYHELTDGQVATPRQAEISIA
ncbi:MAG: hypothetical protein C4K47_07300 [Candidatus Thorarchaeota archaeon]|nr:MAG: hypothetical protein C4K47_07300 [Candidatus Thorarchaeota archaeon]